MLNLEQFRYIYLDDFTNYDDRLCNNGGRYGFWKKCTFLGNHNKIGQGKWEVSYGCTTDLDYCPVCGQFNDHYDEDSWCKSNYSCGEYTIISTRELEERIASFKEEKKFTKEVIVKNDSRHYYMPGELYIEYVKGEDRIADEELSIAVD